MGKLALGIGKMKSRPCRVTSKGMKKKGERVKGDMGCRERNKVFCGVSLCLTLPFEKIKKIPQVPHYCPQVVQGLTLVLESPRIKYGFRL